MIQKRKRWLWRIFYVFLTVLLLFIIWHFNLIVYGIQQGIGQMKIVWNLQSFDDFLAKSHYPDSIKKQYKNKITLIQEIKKFASDSLALTKNENYSKIYDQKGKPILWAVSACKPYQFEAKQWNYGFLGNMPYKGYFDSTKAKNLLKSLKEEGWDVNVYTPSAWSTLGWFNDPILSAMLNWDTGDLANLIIHEMTHSTVWVKGNVEYNENLADFVGDWGAARFLEYKFGKNSKEYLAYQNDKTDSDKFYRHILRGAKKLEQLYQTFKEKDSKTSKDKRKYALIKKIGETLDTVSFINKKNYTKIFAKRLPNNAYFMAFRRYRGQQNKFEKEFKEKFDSNFQKYLAYLKKVYPI